MAEPRLDRLTFSSVFGMADHLRPREARPCRSLVPRAIVNYQNMLKFPLGPLNYIPDVFLFVVSRNDCRDALSILARRRLLHR
jgi:hypothetical protein